jgi:hypothetical protein
VLGAAGLKRAALCAMGAAGLIACHLPLGTRSG